MLKATNISMKYSYGEKGGGKDYGRYREERKTVFY